MCMDLKRVFYLASRKTGIQSLHDLAIWKHIVQPTITKSGCLFYLGASQQLLLTW